MNIPYRWDAYLLFLYSFRRLTYNGRRKCEDMLPIILNLIYIFCVEKESARCSRETCGCANLVVHSRRGPHIMNRIVLELDHQVDVNILLVAAEIRVPNASVGTAASGSAICTDIRGRSASGAPKRNLAGGVRT
jgi:hypothetical protein